MPRKPAKSHTKTKTTRARVSNTRGESMEDVQASIARALLGIIAIAIFIGFILSPGPSIFLP